jgi:hypothetical protein
MSVKMRDADPLVLTDPKLVALGLALGGRLLQAENLPTGRLAFHLSGVPADLAEQLLNDSIQVSARRFVDALEGVYALIAQRRRGRGGR